MDKTDIMLRVQAFVDGELPEAHQSEIASLIARDADVAAMVKELKQTRQALAGYEEALDVPESAGFYWSRIRQAIERLPQPEPVVESPRVSFVGLLARWLVPLGAAAAVGVLAMVWVQRGEAGGDQVEWTALSDDVAAFTYRDYEEGMTLMWLTYAGDNAVADSGEPAIIN